MAASSGAYTDLGYDSRSRITGVTHKNSSASVISSESYVYDSASNLSSKTVDSATTTYGYDAIDQLTSETAPTFTATYTYDANGNRTSKTQGGVTDTYTVDSGDKLTSTSTKSYAYDAAGRTTGVTSGGQTTTVAYDYEDRITSITYPSTATNTFTYNGLDTRVGKVDSAGTKTYKRDGAGVTDPVLADGAANYTPEVSERRSGASSFRHTDRMGSMSRLTNSSQSTTDTRTYDAFGLLVGTT
ncbi:MAG: hypothetical protein HY248_03425, partial [Fimbriimonas ginsengisoli]|nr:hypothetical protein [Fimbriimonas ginsengisoli]